MAFYCRDLRRFPLEASEQSRQCMILLSLLLLPNFFVPTTVLSLAIYY